MWKTKRKLSFALSLFLLCAPFYGSTMQAEAQYRISETELTRLEANLQTLKQHSEQKENLLEKQNEQLITAKNQIKILKTSNAEIEKSLAKANQSLKAYEEEANHKIRVKARQRNLWILISGGLLYVLVNR